MKNLVYLFFIGVLVVLQSCASKVPYTADLQKQFKFTEADLKKVQFYTSDDIILYRKSSSEGTTLGAEEGELVIKSDNTEEEIIIPKGTPGIIEKMVDNNKLAIRFEAGEGKFLIFGGEGNYNGQYKILAEEWANKRGKLTYSGETYYATQSSGAAMLLVVLKKYKKYQREQRKVGGMKVN